MNPVSIPGRCPICGGGPLKPLPLDYAVSVSVTKHGEKQHVGGLVAYVCAERGHVFFVMTKDVGSVGEPPVLQRDTA